MQRIDRKIVAVAMLLFIFVGMRNYFSWEDFIKPVTDQFNLVYSQNEDLKDATSYEKIKQIQGNIEGLVDEKVYPKEQYINLHTLTQLILDKQVISDKSETIVKLKNGYLTFIYSKKDVTKCATNLIKLNEYLQEKDINLLYVQAPFKIDKYEPLLPVGVEDGNNDNADTFLNIIGSKVDYIDIRDEMHFSGVSQYEYFFKTDHHWTPEGAFFAWQSVAKKLNSDHEFQIDKKYTDLNQYNIKVYEDWFLGSVGKRVGPLFGGVDDFSLITPKFDTNFKVEIPIYNIVREGNLENTMLYFNELEPKDYFKKNTYATYSGGDFPLTLIKNNLDTNGKKVLLIRDSFSCTFAPFLATGCKSLDVIDLRHFKDSTLVEYINKTHPDLVLIMYTPSVLNENAFNFF